jgi:hypothetical protein
MPYSLMADWVSNKVRDRCEYVPADVQEAKLT